MRQRMELRRQRSSQGYLRLTMVVLTADGRVSCTYHRALKHRRLLRFVPSRSFVQGGVCFRLLYPKKSSEFCFTCFVGLFSLFLCFLVSFFCSVFWGVHSLTALVTVVVRVASYFSTIWWFRERFREVGPVPWVQHRDS